MGRRLVLFPCPFQGHINPMFQLADVLHAKGFSISILHTELNAPDPTKCPHDLVPVPDGFSCEASSNDLIELIAAINANCEVPFRELMKRMLSAEPIVCVIIDALLYRIQSVAKQLELPVLLLRTGSAACFNVFIEYPLLLKKGYLPIQDSEAEVAVSELPPLRVKDLLRMDGSSLLEVSKLLEQVIKAARSSSGIIFNTFEAIEGAELDKIRKELGTPVFAVGPLHKISQSAQSSMLEQDRGCIEWLNMQAPGSVLYASFGSIASINKEEFMEMAWGLASSKVPFLWVVRAGSVRGCEQVELPRECEQEIQGRGKMVSWAPQQEVLRHPSVGGFWTHNGWNSTLESLSEGVPMLCSPCFSDQMGNARYVSHAWKVGIPLDHGLKRGEIKKVINRLMVEKAGQEMRATAKVLKGKAAQCIEKAGSSSVALGKLLNLISTFVN